MGIAPERPKPDTAYAGVAGSGGVANVQGETEAKIKGAARAPVDAAYGEGRNNLVTNMFGGFGNGIGGLVGMLVQGAFGIIGGVADLIGGLLGIRNKADNASQQVAEQAGSIEGLEARVTALEGGGTRTVLTSNYVWQNPGNGMIGVAVMNGGQCGEYGRFTNNDYAPIGGTHGGYAYKELRCVDLPATVQVTVGAGGATNLQAGGQSSFGNFVVPISGSAGSVLTKQGAVASNSAPGRGGDASSSTSGGGVGTAGRPSALAAGGAAGVGGPGAPGQSVSEDSDVPCGGGGGGAGAGRNTVFQNPYDGGPGGAPGGGGGAGGKAGTANSAATSNPGPGGNGRVILIYTPGSAT